MLGGTRRATTRLTMVTDWAGEMPFCQTAAACPGRMLSRCHRRRTLWLVMCPSAFLQWFCSSSFSRFLRAVSSAACTRGGRGAGKAQGEQAMQLHVAWQPLALLAHACTDCRY